MDWLSDISKLSSLDDINPLNMMIYLRHQYLTSAKSLIKNYDTIKYAIACSEAAENIQSALEVFGVQ